MTLEKLDKNVEIIKDLSTYPNQEEGLSAEELKARFDEGAKIIKEYLNDKVVKAVNAAVTVEPQELTPEQQAQARKNIGAAEQGVMLLSVAADEYGEESEISVTAEHPVMNKDNLVEYGRVAFYETNHDGAVQLVHIADGTKDNHAATVGQVVLNTAQNLTESQKAQARRNIGAAAVGEGGGSAEGAVLYTQQNLSEAQKAQAKENIGASDFYHTEREEVKATHNEIDTEYIYGLYDALGLQGTTLAEVTYKDKDGNDKTLPIKEYVISTGERSTNGYFTKLHDADEHIKKPKYLVMSGIHGRERKTAISVYRFVCDLLAGHNIPKEFAEGAIIHVLPVANPTGFNEYTRWNGNQVDINRNFPHGGEWVETWYDSDFDGEVDDYTNGDSAASEMETKAIIQWMEDNNDAQLFLDVHNGSQTNEIVCVFGMPGNDQVDAVKNIALRGIDRIIPYWRDVIQYPASMKEADPYYEDEKLVFGTKDESVIFAYSVSAKESLNSSAFYYASNVVGIPGIALEMSTYYGDWDEWYQDDQEQKYELAYHPESIAAGAEIVGNILLEFYEHGDMTLQKGTPIYNGEALLNISIKTHTHYKGEVTSV